MNKLLDNVNYRSDGLLANKKSILIAKSQQKSRNQFAGSRKRSPPHGPGSCLRYTFI